MRIDRDGFSRLGLDQDSTAGRYAAECGFEPFARDDGLHPDFIYDPEASYERYLRERGTTERTSGRTGPTRGPTRMAHSSQAGTCGMHGSPRAFQRNTVKRQRSLFWRYKSLWQCAARIENT